MVMVLDTMVMDMDMDCGDARRGKLKPNLLLLPNHLLIPTSTMDVDMVFMVDTMVMVLDTMVMDMDMDCGDARRGKLKPNPQPNHLLIPTPTMDMDMDLVMVMEATIGENKPHNPTTPNINILPQSA